MLTLCGKCAEAGEDENFSHDEIERALSGTSVIDELLKALEKEYKIIKKMEIWKYNTIVLKILAGSS